ncbi:MAG: hypothetical protein HKN54_10115 [Flavobacteriaceae bacterium]|nr:hypothetical protein [Flavobacteriaceae bacterium]
MKNLIIGLILGILITLGSTEFLDNKNQDSQNSLVTDADTSEILLSDKEISDEEFIEDAHLAAIEEIKLLEAEVKDLASENRELKTKLTAIAESSDEEKGTKADNFNFDDIEVTQSDLELARNNIQVAMLDAEPEYKDFMQKQIKGALSDLEFFGYSEKGLIDHHNQSVDHQWASDAELFLKTYFANQTNKKYHLIKFTCHTDSCELFAQYFSDKQIDNELMPVVSMSIFEFLRNMLASPGFSNYFTANSLPSTSRSDDEMSIFIHSIMRRAK